MQMKRYKETRHKIAATRSRTEAQKGLGKFFSNPFPLCMANHFLTLPSLKYSHSLYFASISL